MRDEEVAIERPDGRRIVALVNIEAIRDNSGQVIGAVNVFRERPEPRPEQSRPNGGGPNSHQILLGLPVAVYATEAAERILSYNEAAAELWGARPKLGTTEFCGSWKLCWPDGTPLPHDDCPMALALKHKRPIRGMEAYRRTAGWNARSVHSLSNAAFQFHRGSRRRGEHVGGHHGSPRSREPKSRERGPLPDPRRNRQVLRWTPS